MSFQEEKRESIRRYLLEKIRQDDGAFIQKTIENFEISVTTVKRYLRECVQNQMYKGKLTTNPANHSGEGVFFTSKMLSEFAIWSDNAILSMGCYEKEKLVMSHLLSYFIKLEHIGTMIVMKLENQSTRKIEEVFNMFAPIDEGFIKTRIPIKEVCQYGEPIARSQARRILYRLEEFKQVELDFEGIEFMGQGFADEIFRIFQGKHPEIEIIPIRACQNVLGMIKHVQRS